MSTPKKTAAKPVATPRAPAAEGAVPGLRIISRPPTFRRAGYEFTAEAREIALSELTGDQVAALKAEKMLVVVDCDIAVEAEAAAE